MRISAIAGLIGALVSGGALQAAPTTSLFPVARSGGVAEIAALQAPSPAQVGADGVTVNIAAAAQARPQLRAPVIPLRPEPRPSQAQAVAGSAPTAAAAAEPAVVTPVSGRVQRSLVPVARPEGRASGPTRVVRAGLFAGLTARANSGQSRQPRKGSVCGDRSLRGVKIAPIKGKLAGCGVAEPVKVTEVDGITLSQASIMDCATAQALKSWINEGVRPAVGRRGGGLSGLKVAAHYSCRTRNHRPGAKISEHGKGRAIDISALILKNGEAITVLDGWRQRREGKILKAAHAAACGPFGTVLGPEADRQHQDHFHFDTARYRSGAYCR